VLAALGFKVKAIQPQRLRRQLLQTAAAESLRYTRSGSLHRDPLRVSANCFGQVMSGTLSGTQPASCKPGRQNSRSTPALAGSQLSCSRVAVVVERGGMARCNE
jgi:hypothetical protein